MVTALRAIRALLVFSILTGVVYPLGMTAVAQLALSRQAHGSIMEVSDEVVGSELIGQTWQGIEWFYGRPSAVDYDAAASGATNLGPLSKELSEQIQQRAEAIRDLESPYRGEFEIAAIPVDLVTSSGSGLDPDISVAAALFQMPRIAEVRGLSQDQVYALIVDATQPKTLGIWGQERVNVLKLNLAVAAAART